MKRQIDNGRPKPFQRTFSSSAGKVFEKGSESRAQKQWLFCRTSTFLVGCVIDFHVFGGLCH